MIETPQGPPQGQNGGRSTTGGGGDPTDSRMPERPVMGPARRVRTPLWRRLAAFFTLSFVSVLAGLVLAAALGTAALVMLFLLERAIAT